MNTKYLFRFTKIVFFIFLLSLFTLYRLLCMRANRFFVRKPLGEETSITDLVFVHQIKNVLRLEVKNTLILFNDLEPFDYLYAVEIIKKDKISLRFIKTIDKAVEEGSIILYLSLFRKELFEFACLKATELGVTHMVPLITHNTQRHFLNTARLETIVKEASEQSGRNVVPVIHEAISFPLIVSSMNSFAVKKEHSFVLSLFGHDIVSHFTTVSRSESVAFFVGPEGGWSEYEENYFTTEKLNTVTISPHILRAETASIICTYLSFLLRKQGYTTKDGPY